MKQANIVTGLALAAFGFAALQWFKKSGGKMPSVFAAVPGGKVAEYARGSWANEFAFSNSNISGFNVLASQYPVYQTTPEQQQADAGGGFQ